MASHSSENLSDMTLMSSTSQFSIDYSKVKCLPTGDCIYSPLFSVGGHYWSLGFYPQGYKQVSHASLYIFLESIVSKEINVECTFQVLAKERKFITIGNPKILKLMPSFCDKEEVECAGGERQFLVRDTIEKLYCVNGVLVICCSIRVLHENPSPLTEPRMVHSYHGGLYDHIERLWEKGERFDVTFEVEGQSISAHRLMLAARSLVFEAELFGSMAESKTERIKIDEMEAEVFKTLLHFIYTDDLAKEGSDDNESLPDDFLRGLFVAADRYGLDKLTLMCEEQLEMNLSVDIVVSTLLFADRYSRAGLKKKCLDFASCPENFLLVALTEDYVNGMPGAPSLLLSYVRWLSLRLILQKSKELVSI